MSELFDLNSVIDERSTVLYGLRLPDGSLVRIDKGYDDSCCLSDNPFFPLFLTTDPHVIAETLFENRPSYNSDSVHPSWGEFTIEQLSPVKIKFDIDIELANIEPLEDIGPWVVETRDSFRSFKDKTRVVWVLVNGTMDQWRSRVGQKLAFGSWYNQRLVLEVREAEEEWADLCKDKQGVIFICERN